MNSWRPAPVNPSWVPSASVLCLGGRVKERLGQHQCCTELHEDEGGVGGRRRGGRGGGRDIHMHTLLLFLPGLILDWFHLHATSSHTG